VIALLGLLGPRIFETCGASIADLGEEHRHRVLRVGSKGGKVVLVPLPPAVARAIDRAVDGRTDGPILRNMIGARMDRHAATRQLKHLARAAGVRLPRMHPLSISRHDVGMHDDGLYEYVAWFHDESLPADDEDHEWPGVIFVRANNSDSALAWGDELAKTCADTFVRSTVERRPNPVPASSVVVSFGERLAAAEIGW
jgi:hypothetical protein